MYCSVTSTCYGSYQIGKVSQTYNLRIEILRGLDREYQYVTDGVEVRSLVVGSDLRSSVYVVLKKNIVEKGE